MVKNLEKQVYVLSIISMILSIVFGLGMIYSIATLVMSVYLYNNYKVNKDKLEQTILYCLCSIGFSIIFMMLEYSIIMMY